MPKSPSPGRAREARIRQLRSLARRDGLELVKDRQTDCWHLVDPATNFVTAGEYGSLPDLDDVERCLNG